MEESSRQRLFDGVYSVLLKMGHATGCHQRDDRSFHWGTKKYPVCARCLGIDAGAILGEVVILTLHLPAIWFVVLCLPLVIDGLIQQYGKYESTNYRRMVTGTLFGIGIVNLVFKILI